MKKVFFFLIAFLPVVAIIVLNLTLSMVSETISISVESISFSQNTVVTNIGEKVVLEPTIFPSNASNKTLKWESSNNEVAQVTPLGEVSLLDFGSAYVSATTLDGNKRASLYFIVTDSVVHKVNLYTIDNQKSVKVGETLQVYAEVLPVEAENKTVTYTSSNTSVASINHQGVVTAKGVGSSVIVGTSQDGGHFSSLEISVYEGITSMSLPEYHLSETSSFVLDLNIMPKTAYITTAKLSSSNPEIATVDKMGNVTFLKPGIVTISAQYQNITTTGLFEYTNGYASDLILNETSKTINFNKRVWKIEYDIFPKNLYNTEIEFSSSNNQVATVDKDGLVTFEGGGASVITLKTYKSDGTLLTKQITLFVKRDVEKIEAKNILTALNQVKVVYSSLPFDATNSVISFSTDSSIASVDNNGVVTFAKAGQADIEIIAKGEFSTISKTISVEYTNGFATDFELERVVEVNQGLSFELEARYTPFDATVKNLTLEILSQVGNDQTDNGVILIANGSEITALKGGIAVVRATLETINNQTISKIVEIKVFEPINQINWNINLEMMEDIFVTGKQIVDFSVQTFPKSASDKTVLFEITENSLAASLQTGKVVFNYPAQITLKAYNKVSGIVSFAKIRYTTTILKVEFEEFPKSLVVGQKTQIKIKNFLPSDLSAEVSLRKNNESTKINGQVVALNLNEITAINGGSSNLAVYVGGLYQTSFELTIIRYAESVNVLPKDVKITAQRLNLNHSIYPIDTTASQVSWKVENSELAYVENNVLFFNGFGTAFITATVQDEMKASISFTIERIVSSPETFPPTESSLEMFVENVLQLSQSQGNRNEYEVVGSKEVIEVSASGLVKAIKAGQAQLKYLVYNNFDALIESYQIDFYVYNPVTQIILNENNFTPHNGEYLTALKENSLLFSLLPAENVKEKVNFSLNSTSLATIENNKLVFFAEGLVSLVGVSEDGNITSVWNIRYTGGFARDFVLNFSDGITLEKGASVVIQIEKWIPSNTINKNLSLQTFTSESLQYIELENQTITAKKGGSAEILVRVSDILTKTIFVKITEDVSSIQFENNKILIAEIEYVLNPTILPSSASNKTLLYEIDNSQVASIVSNKLVFKKAGTVLVKATSESNPNVQAEIEVTSTAGYPNNIVLNVQEKSMFTGEVFNILVTEVTPKNVSDFELVYEIINQTNAQGLDVVSVSKQGQVKAVNFGKATIRVSVVNEYGLNVYKDIQIVVLQYTNGLSINFEKETTLYNNIFITGQKELKYEILSLPNNSQTTDYKVESFNQNVASIEKGKILFFESGIINVVFTSLINPNVVLNITINYVGETALSVKVDESKFSYVNGKKQITLPYNTLFEFEIIETLPKDISQEKVQITIVKHERNSELYNVAEISNGKISLLNGGKIEINLNINNYNLGNYVFEVVRPAKEIYVENDEMFTALPYYELFAKVLPEDASNKILSYTSLTPLIATVNQAGQVEFISVGNAQIKIENSANGLSKIVSVRYTRQIQKISFDESEITLSVSATTLLNPKVFPLGIDYQLVYVSDNNSVATANEQGRIITGQQEGVAIITVYVVGNSSLTATIKVRVIKYITNIALELDPIDDNKGIAGKRVFGNLFYTNENKISNTYQMYVLSILPSDSHDTLVWSSSNNEIAEVDQTGKVVFKDRVGEVTIRVQPKNQFNPNRPVYDSYTFVLVDGINVYNFEQFYKVISDKNPQNAVLQDNAVITQKLIDDYKIKEVQLKTNVYGNGYMLSLSGLNINEHKMVVSSSGVTIDNVVLRGENMDGSKTLDDMARTKALLIVWETEDINIKNTLFENGYILLKVYESKVKVSGSIFQNAGFAHIQLAHTTNSPKQTVLTVKNTVYKDALIAAIVFDFDESSSQEFASKLIVEGIFLVYNFRKVSEILSPALLEKVPDILRGIITSNKNALLGFLNYIKHSYKGEEYYNLAIMQIDISYTVDSKKSPGSVDISKISTNYYRYFEATNSIQILSATLRLYTIMPGSNTLNPESTFDSSIYKDIREN